MLIGNRRQERSEAEERAAGGVLMRARALKLGGLAAARVLGFSDGADL